MNTVLRSWIVGAVCLVVVPTPADNGVIPIWEPTTITQPGRYVLVRNIGDESLTNVITIDADGVDLDLNGFTIRCMFTAIHAWGVRGLSIHDGFVHCAGETVLLQNVENFTLRRVVSVTETGELAVVIEDSTNGVVEGNTVRIGGDDALWVTGSVVAVRDNRFDADVQIYVSGSEVSGNLVRNGSLTIAHSGNVVRDNVVWAPWGGQIRVDGSDNLVFRNTVNTASGNGISVGGSLNQLVDNVANMNGGFGLYLGATSSGNVYRGNTARGNGGSGCPTANSDFCDYGSNNTSHGDNYMPGRQ